MDGESSLICRSKNVEIDLENPGMFELAVQAVVQFQDETASGLELSRGVSAQRQA